MDKTTTKAIKKLTSHLLLIGGILRRKGAEALIHTQEPEAVAPLINALSDKKEKVRQAALESLRSLKGSALNRLCSLWAEKRDPALEDIITTCSYIATEPLSLRHLTALKQGEMSIPKGASGEGVDILLELIKDTDTVISQNAHKALRSLTNEKGVTRLCSLWAEKRDPALEDIITTCSYIATEPPLLMAQTFFLQERTVNKDLTKETLDTCLVDTHEAIAIGAVEHLLDHGRGYEDLWAFSKEHPDSHVARCLNRKDWHPDDIAERALFYFLADDMEHYHDIDFEQSHLRYWHETAAPVLKDAIASRIRQSGDTRLLAVFRTERGGTKQGLTEKDAELQIGILKENKDYAKLFSLLPLVGYHLGSEIISVLQEAGWQSPEAHGRELQERLKGMIKTKEKDTIPSSYAMSIYNDFRPMLLSAASSLVRLAEERSPSLPDTANEACADPLWQVRMAAAAAELFVPGTLSPANRALLEADHVYWVQALLTMPSGGRLVDLGPEGLEELRYVPERAGPQKRPQGPDTFRSCLMGIVPSAEREYLLTLGEFLGTDISVSEDQAYDAGETDVEIELDEDDEG
jgi:hypothetical protein